MARAPAWRQLEPRLRHAPLLAVAQLDEPDALGLQIELPNEGDVGRLTRIVRALPDVPALDIELRIDARRRCTLPGALHPTLRLDLGRMRLDVSHAGPGLSYPVPAEPGRSRAAPAGP